MDKRLQLKNEILRYLGYKDQRIDNIVDGLIEDSIDEIKTLISERYIYKSFDIGKDKEELYLMESNLCLSGKSIRKHLQEAKTCILMAVTLGHEVDTKIRYYEKTNMTKALILDACGSAFIEEICDRLGKEIQDKLMPNEKLTSRFSPGYGDLPINIQKDFVSTLGAEKSIGITVTSNSILIPRKSVTAIVGVVDKGQRTETSNCVNCNKYPNCKFTREGKDCGY